MKALLASGFAIALSGCVTVGEVRGGTTGRYLGYVRVVQPLSVNADVRFEEVTTIGGWVEPGPLGGGMGNGGVGFRRAERARVAPGSCSLTIVVSNDAQLAAVETLIRTYAEGQACLLKRSDED